MPISGQKGNPEESWRRIVLRTARVIAICREQQVQTELVALYSHRIINSPRATSSEEELVQVQDSTVTKLKGSTATRMEILARHRLTDCKDKSRMKQCKVLNPMVCQHPWLLGTGNMRGAWWVCMECPGRWPRTNVLERFVKDWADALRKTLWQTYRVSSTQVMS